MPIQTTISSIIWGDSDDEFDGTVEVNFAPKPAFAHVALYQTIGDGRSAVGIRSFEFRTTPSGPNKTKNFSEFYWNWLPSAFNPLMTRVTFGISIYDVWCSAWWAVEF
jgi:hypothetical protein